MDKKMENAMDTEIIMGYLNPKSMRNNSICWLVVGVGPRFHHFSGSRFRVSDLEFGVSRS